MIDARQIDRGLAQNIQDLVRYEPSVSVNNDPNRFGAAGFDIRGLGGHRVIIQMDRVRAPNYFQFGIGPFNTSNRNFVDLDSVKTVEILRGPASTTEFLPAAGGYNVEVRRISHCDEFDMLRRLAWRKHMLSPARIHVQPANHGRHSATGKPARQR